MKIFGRNKKIKDDKKTEKNEKEENVVKEEKKSQVVEEKEAKDVSSTDSYLYSLIKKPRLSEKALELVSSQNKYIFDVVEHANKTEIKKAIEKIFNVEVVKVNIVKRPHKPKNLRGIIGKKGGVKKAIVTIKKGQKIPIYPEQK